MSNITILESIKATYPEFSEAKAKALIMRTMSWLAVIGSSTTTKIEEAKAKETNDVEERAIVLALSVVAQVIAIKYTAESDKLNDLVTQLLSIDNDGITI